MDDRALAARRAGSMRAIYSALATGSPGAETVSFGDVQATVIPACPRRSIVNAVVCDHVESLLDCLPELAAVYERAGVAAWTVWLSDGDERVRAALAAAGHVLDGNPAPMEATLREMRLEPDAEVELELDDEAGWDTVARINGLAYGIGEDFLPALGGLDDTTGHVYVIRLDGEPAACVTAHDHAGDCGIYFVATVPAARGRGLSTELMRRALRDARARGCETTSLEASKAGEPIYRRLGYRRVGSLELWERRRPGS